MGSELAFAFETLAVPSADVTVTLTKTVYDPAGNHLPVKKALVTVNPGPPISYKLDGSTATFGTGHKLTAYGSYSLEGYDNIKNFQTTSASSGTAGSISVTYLR